MTARCLASARRRRWLPDAAGIAFVVFVALLYLSPALKDGFSFGPADVGVSTSYLTRDLGTTPIHNHLTGDVIDQDVPWNTVDWTIVHAGSLPLWNSYEGTGMPQLFNFESAALALPTLIGYLFPLTASFLVTVLGKLLLAGIGTYVCCRVLRTGALGATLGGVSFMLSGSFSGWLGWAVSGPVAWSGFLLAGIVLCARSRRQLRQIWLLAGSVAFAVYGGFPEGYVLLGGVLGAVAAVAAVGTALRRRLAWRGLARVGIGVGAGLALAAPLWLPGISVVARSARLGKDLDAQLPIHLATLFLAQGYYGLPIAGSTWFGPSNYVESAAYVGVVALVLGLVALAVAWRRPIVVALGLGVVGGVLFVYHTAGYLVPHLLNRVGLSGLAVGRTLPLLAFFLAVLAGIGGDAVVRRAGERGVRIALGAATAAVAVVIGLLWRTVDAPDLLSTYQDLRRASLLWPSATIALLVAVWLGVTFPGRLAAPGRRRLGAAVGVALVASQAAFLLFAGVGENSYATRPFPTTPYVAEVEKVVGSGLLGIDGPNVTCGNIPPTRVREPCGVRLWAGIGFIPDIEDGYGPTSWRCTTRRSRRPTSRTGRSPTRGSSSPATCSPSSRRSTPSPWRAATGSPPCSSGRGS